MTPRTRRASASGARPAPPASPTRGAPPASDAALRRLSELFRALADGTRLEMLERLARASDSLCVCDLECCFDLSQPTVSHHLKVLREAGLVTCERRGTWVHCAVDREGLGRIAAFAARLGSSPAASPNPKGKRS